MINKYGFYLIESYKRIQDVLETRELFIGTSKSRVTDKDKTLGIQCAYCDVSNNYRSRCYLSQRVCAASPSTTYPQIRIYAGHLALIKVQHQVMKEMTRVVVSRDSTFENTASVYGRPYSTSTISALH